MSQSRRKTSALWCPEPGTRGGGLSSINSEPQYPPQLIGTCPVVEVCMGGVNVPYLLDTGSMVTTITEDFFMEHFQSQGAGQLQQLVKVSGRQRAHNPLFWVLRIRCEDFGQKPPKDGRVSH